MYSSKSRYFSDRKWKGERPRVAYVVEALKEKVSLLAEPIVVQALFRFSVTNID